MIITSIVANVYYISMILAYKVLTNMYFGRIVAFVIAMYMFFR